MRVSGWPAQVKRSEGPRTSRARDHGLTCLSNQALVSSPHQGLIRGVRMRAEADENAALSTGWNDYVAKRTW